MKSILDPSFRYVPSTATDLRKTFSRIRREMQGTEGERPRSANAEVSRVLMFPQSKEAARP